MNLGLIQNVTLVLVGRWNTIHGHTDVSDTGVGLSYKKAEK